MRLPLAVKINTVGFLTTLVGIIGIAFFLYNDARALLHQQALENLAGRQTKAMAQLQGDFETLQHNLQFIAESGPLARLLHLRDNPLNHLSEAKADRFWSQRFNGMLDIILREHPFYENAFVISLPSLKIISGVRRTTTGTEPMAGDETADTLLFPELIAQLQSGSLPSLLLSPIKGNQASAAAPATSRLQCVLPVLANGSPTANAVALTINFSQLTGKALLEEPESGTGSFMAAETGRLLSWAGPRSRDLFQQLVNGAGRFDPGQLPTGSDDKTSPGIVDLQPLGLGLSVQQFTPFQTPDSPRLHFVMGQSFSELDQKSTALRDTFITVFLIGSFVVFLLLAGVTFWLTRPIRQLTETAKKISNGAGNITIPQDSNDEIGDLARSLAIMVRRLEERTEQLDTTYRELLHAEKLSAVGMLAASIAHEFGSPIFAIRNMLDTARLKGTPISSEHLTLAIDECERMKDLLANLQEFSTPSDETIAKVQFHELIEEVLALYNKQLQTKGITIQKLFYASLPAVNGIRDQLKQVILNLLTNAVNAMPDGGSLTIRTAVIHKMVEVSIQDTGHGIASDNLDKIFTPFFTTRKRQNGSGLGLSVSHSIISQHGGKIAAYSEVGKGSTFTISLPVS